MTAGSWADVAKQGTAAASPPEAAPLVPGRRGARTCLCRGEVLAMLGHYGWLIPCQETRHPEAARHQGRVYVNVRDVLLPKGARPLAEGDRVEFYLYAEDGHGLGAEECRPVGPAPAAAAPLPSPWAFPSLSWSSEKRPRPSAGGERRAKAPAAVGWNVDAPEFVCSAKPSGPGHAAARVPAAQEWNPFAAEFVPEPAAAGPESGAAQTAPPEGSSGLRPSAAEFVPGAAAVGGLRPGTEEFVPMAVGVFDPDEWLTDDEDGSDDECDLCSDAGVLGPRPSAEEFVPKAGGVFNADVGLADDEGGSDDDQDSCSDSGVTQASVLTTRIAQIFKADAWLSEDEDDADSSGSSTEGHADGGGDDADSGCSIETAPAPNNVLKELAAGSPSRGACSTASTTDSEGGSACASDAEAPAAPQAAPSLRLPPGLLRHAKAVAAPQSEPGFGPPPGLPSPSLRVFRSSLAAFRSELYALSY